MRQINIPGARADYADEEEKDIEEEINSGIIKCLLDDLYWPGVVYADEEEDDLLNDDETVMEEEGDDSDVETWTFKLEEGEDGDVDKNEEDTGKDDQDEDVCMNDEDSINLLQVEGSFDDVKVKQHDPAGERTEQDLRL